MANFRGPEESQVGLSRQPTPSIDVPANPQAFGIGLGQAVQQVGEEAGQIAIRERRMKAIFDATDQELSDGVKIDQTLDSFKEKLRGGKPNDGEAYSDYVKRSAGEFTASLGEIHKEGIKALKDPLAQKNYDVRMRLQTQAAARHAMVAGDQQIHTYMQTKAQDALDAAVQRAGNISGNPATDLANIQTQAMTGLAPLQVFLGSRLNLGPEEVRKQIAKAERDMVAQALTAYEKAGDYKGGLAILNGAVGPLRVGNDPKNAQGESVLNGAATQAWQAKFEYLRDQANAVQKEKVGATLGSTWYFDSVKDPNAAAKAYVKGGGDPAEAAKAVQTYTTLVSEAHTRHEIAVGDTYESAFKYVNKKYGGDIDKALLSNDPAFKRMYEALGPKQSNLRTALAKDEPKDTPEAYAALGKVIDLTSTPGALSKKYPTAAAFQAEFQGATKNLWPKAIQMYEADVKRDTSQDAHYQIYKNDVDMRTRNVTKWTHNGDPTRNTWDGAQPEQRAIHTWMSLATEQAWLDHQQARKQTPGKVSDVTWMNDTLSEITRQAEMLKKRGAFKNGTMPGMAQTPASATNIPTINAPEMSPEQYAASPKGTRYRMPGSTKVLVKE